MKLCNGSGQSLSWCDIPFRVRQFGNNNHAIGRASNQSYQQDYLAKQPEDALEPYLTKLLLCGFILVVHTKRMVVASKNSFSADDQQNRMVNTCILSALFEVKQSSAFDISLYMLPKTVTSPIDRFLIQTSLQYCSSSYPNDWKPLSG